jgi:hypothetical protein
MPCATNFIIAINRWLQHENTFELGTNSRLSSYINSVQEGKRGVARPVRAFKLLLGLKALNARQNARPWGS